MASGLYRDLVNIKVEDSADGSPLPGYDTVLYSYVPCQIEATSGNESFRGRQLEAHVDYVVTMHYLEDLKPNMRLEVQGGIYDGRLLNIANVLPQTFRGRALTMDLYCRELVVL